MKPTLLTQRLHKQDAVTVAENYQHTFNSYNNFDVPRELDISVSELPDTKMWAVWLKVKY